MDYKEIKKLMDDMGNSKLTEMEIEIKDGLKISMKKDNGMIKANPTMLTVPQVQTQSLIQQTPVAVPDVKKDEPLKVKEEVTGNVVKSPMVGTFYSKPSPDVAPFVKIGSKVKKGDKLCIIEAMKLMNEIESEYDGEVVDILVKDEEMVDYGKPLFIIK